ncbi:MAG: GNAT family N-acetyltransferase [Spirochaetes bacterium]|jgi:GNAT superfamily N-acetyltransferase|nr:GNAT family N-acetyltransferase [Spirochaetota bacterium]
MFTIDRMGFGDLQALSGLYLQLVGEASELTAMQRVFREIDSRDDYFLLGARAEDGTLVGSLMGVICLDLCRDCSPLMVLENLVTDSAWRGKGVARMLMLEGERIAREKGCVFVQFCSSHYRKEAHRLYESLGYDPSEVKGYRKYFKRLASSGPS